MYGRPIGQGNSRKAIQVHEIIEIVGAILRIAHGIESTPGVEALIVRESDQGRPEFDHSTGLVQNGEAEGLPLFHRAEAPEWD